MVTSTERIRESKRKWKRNNKEKVRASWRSYYQRHKKKRNSYTTDYYWKHREHILSLYRGFHKWDGQNRKFSIMAMYSNFDTEELVQPKCACCGETNIEFLSIDHINQNGAEHRRTLPKNRRCGSGFYNWLIKNGFPEGYRVLCLNCNFALGHFGYCPHEFLN